MEDEDKRKLRFIVGGVVRECKARGRWIRTVEEKKQKYDDCKCAN